MSNWISNPNSGELEDENEGEMWGKYIYTQHGPTFSPNPRKNHYDIRISIEKNIQLLSLIFFDKKEVQLTFWEVNWGL